jgi:hypothetical protein
MVCHLSQNRHVGVSFSVLLKTVLAGIVLFLIVSRYVKWFGFAKPLKTDMHVMLGRSGWFLGWNLVTTLLIASDVVVLGLCSSIVAVTNYSLTKYVPEMMISIIANIIFAIMPGLGGIIGAGDLKRAGPPAQRDSVLCLACCNGYRRKRPAC